MQLKRIFARDNHSALKMVREQIGPDAIIISNRKTDNGVEVIATADYDENDILQSMEAGDQSQPSSSSNIEHPVGAETSVMR